MTDTTPSSARPEANNLVERMEEAFNNPNLPQADKEALQAEAKHFFLGGPPPRRAQDLNEAYYRDVLEQSRKRTGHSAENGQDIPAKADKEA